MLEEVKKHRDAMLSLERQIEALHKEKIQHLRGLHAIQLQCKHVLSPPWHEPPSSHEDPEEGDVCRRCINCDAFHLCQHVSDNGFSPGRCKYSNG